MRAPCVLHRYKGSDRFLLFDETLIAKGFDRVVTTWQGMVWEHSKDDICFGNLSKIEFTVDGIEAWRANGVSVFRLTKPDKRTKPRAHRFAVNPTVEFVGIVTLSGLVNGTPTFTRPQFKLRKN